MHFTLTCFASLLVVNVVDAAMDRSIPALVPRNHITHEYIDACQVVNCTVTPHERAQCLLDCPPLAGPTGSPVYGSHSTSRGDSEPSVANLSIFTYTQTITKIPDYCLPGGPAAPHANVPTTSLEGADAFISAVSAVLETAVPELDSESEDQAGETEQSTPAPVPAIVTGSMGQVVRIANSTSPTYSIGPLATPTETDLGEEMTSTASRMQEGFTLCAAILIGFAMGYAVSTYF